MQEFPVLRVWYDPSQFCFKAGMTAVAIAYTPFGFAVAADGRETSRMAHGTTMEQDTTDQTQKIFEAHYPDSAICYSVTGRVAKGASYDFIGYASGQAKKLSSKIFRDSREYRNAFSERLLRYLQSLKRDGILEYRESPLLDAEDISLIVSIHIVGYFKGTPFWRNAHFYHEKNGGVYLDTNGPPLVYGLRVGMGSDIVPNLCIKNDPRFEKYQRRLNMTLEDASRETAIDWTSAYIELCSEPLAAEVDPICRMIGGHIHIATVTKSQGFQWVAGREPICQLNE